MASLPIIKMCKKWTKQVGRVMSPEEETISESQVRFTRTENFKANPATPFFRRSKKSMKNVSVFMEKFHSTSLRIVADIKATISQWRKRETKTLGWIEDIFTIILPFVIICTPVYIWFMSSKVKCFTCGLTIITSTILFLSRLRMPLHLVRSLTLDK